jgi:hypothetical protein
MHGKKNKSWVRGRVVHPSVHVFSGNRGSAKKHVGYLPKQGEEVLPNSKKKLNCDA